MQTGVLLNSFTCFLIFIFTLSASIRIYRQGKNELADLAFAGFWFLTSFTWLFVGSSMIAAKYGRIDWGISIDQYFTQTLVFIQITLGSYFATYRVFKNRKLSLMFTGIYIALTCLSLYYVYQKGGVVLTKTSYFTIEFGTSRVPWIIFQTMFGLAMVGIFFDTLRNLYYWFKKSNLFQLRYLLAGLSILIYGVIGYFEEQGYSENLVDLAVWIRLAMRILLIFCAHLAFLAYSQKEV